MTEQVPSVHIWKAATCPLLMCLQRQHSITDGAASLTQRAWEWRSWVGSDCMRAFFQQLVFALTSFDGNSMTQSERNRGVKGKTLSIFALRWTNAQRMCQVFPILTHTTSERRSLDFEKRTKFTRQFKVAEMDENLFEAELDTKPLCVYCELGWSCQGKMWIKNSKKNIYIVSKF